MASSVSGFLSLQPYAAPLWAQHLKLQPRTRYRLGLLPTPLHRWQIPGLPEGTELWIKRDDLSGCQLSGNKVRKLEFLLADAVESGADCIVTVGGIQSNHARATAVAASYLGLPCHLVLRNSRQLVDSDPGLVGNLLVERLVGAHIHQVTKEEYARHGAATICDVLISQLRSSGKKPYYIPVGGSSALGVWGYIAAVAELDQQAQEAGLNFDVITSACGSAGTTAGLALGVELSGLRSRGCAVHSYGVCDDEAYFLQEVDTLLTQLGHTGPGAEQLFKPHQARGEGYALAREEELATVLDTALSSGVILDPVYTGKALHELLSEMAANPDEWAGKRVCFIHTGGLLGCYDKTSQLAPLVEGLGRSHRLDVSGCS